MNMTISEKAIGHFEKAFALSLHQVPDQDKIRLSNIKALSAVAAMGEPPITFNPDFAIWSCENLRDQMHPGHEERAATRIIAAMVRDNR